MMYQCVRFVAGRAVLVVSLVFTGAVIIGCEQKEKILDVKTPNRSVEIERSNDTGNADVNVERRKQSHTEVEAPNVRVKVERSKGSGSPNVDVDTNK